MWKARFTPWTKMQAREPDGHVLASSGCPVYTGWYWMVFSLMCHTLHLSVTQWDANNVFFPLGGRRKTLLAPHTHLTPIHVAVYLQLLPAGHPTCTPKGRLHTSVPSARYSLVAQGERTQPGDVLHQLAEEWQQLNLLTCHPQLRPAHVRAYDRLCIGMTISWSTTEQKEVLHQLVSTFTVTVTQQLPCSAPLVVTKWCPTVTTFPAQCIGSLAICNAYLNFHMCHQDCKVGEVVAGARGVCLVSCQEATALGGPIPCHCTFRVAPEGTVWVKIFFWLLQGRN